MKQSCTVEEEANSNYDVKQLITLSAKNHEIIKLIEDVHKPKFHDETVHLTIVKCTVSS